MRITLIIVVLTLIAVAKVHVRRATDRTNYQIQQLQLQDIYLRRELYSLQADLGRQIAPQRLRERMKKMDIRLTNRVAAPPVVAQRLSADDCDQ